MGFLDALQTWDRARARPAYRVGGIALGLAAAGAVLSAPRPEGLSETGQGAAALTVVMALWWLGGVLPIAVTALVPLVALPILGISDMRAAAAPYADPLNVLMLGGFLLACAMEEVGLHRRVVAALLAPQWVRRSPRRSVLALMVAAASVSAFVNNTASMLMMLPIALGMATRASEGEPAGAARVRAAFVLCAAYACSIGGVSTLVGTAPNAVLAGLAPKVAGRGIGFVEWMCVGVPFVALSLPLAWIVVTRFVLPVPEQGGAAEAPERPAPSAAARIVTFVLAACFLAWLTRAPVRLGGWEFRGWGASMPVKVDDGFVAIVAALVLFALPRPGGAAGPSSEGVHDDDADEGAFLLSWRRAARAIPWPVLVLMGGGFALADAIQSSGLSTWLAGPMSRLGVLPPLAQTFLICVGVAFMSAFTSNTATTQIVLPLLGAGAVAAGGDPLLWMVPATISASCDFSLAVGTPPNAIAAEAGPVAPADMLTAGVVLNVLCALVATGVVMTIGAAVL